PVPLSYLADIVLSSSLLVPVYLSRSSLCPRAFSVFFFFFFTAPSPTEIYTLSLHDALPISLSFGLSLTPMDRVALFRNCALVQAFPVVTGVVLSTVQRGRLDLAYAPYGTFFSWFALMAWAATATIRQGGETRC